MIPKIKFHSTQPESKADPDNGIKAISLVPRPFFMRYTREKGPEYETKWPCAPLPPFWIPNNTLLASCSMSTIQHVSVDATAVEHFFCLISYCTRSCLRARKYLGRAPPSSVIPGPSLHRFLDVSAPRPGAASYD